MYRDEDEVDDLAFQRDLEKIYATDAYESILWKDYDESLNTFQLIYQNEFSQAMLASYGSMTSYVYCSEVGWDYGCVTLHVIGVTSNTEAQLGAVMLATENEEEFEEDFSEDSEADDTSTKRCRPNQHTEILMKLKSYNPNWSPRYSVFLESSSEEIQEAWITVFPDTQIIYSTDEIKKSWRDWIKANVKGIDQKHTLRLAVSIVHAATDTKASECERLLIEKGDPGFVKHYQENYHNIKERWAICYRTARIDWSNSSQAVDSLFNDIKNCSFGSAWREDDRREDNRKIKDVIKSIHCCVKSSANSYLRENIECRLLVRESFQVRDKRGNYHYDEDYDELGDYSIKEDHRTDGLIWDSIDDTVPYSFVEHYENEMRVLDLEPTVKEVEDEASGTIYLVSYGGKTHRIDPELPSCTCRTFVTTRFPCRHIFHLIEEEHISWDDLPSRYSCIPYFVATWYSEPRAYAWPKFQVKASTAEDYPASEPDENELNLKDLEKDLASEIEDVEKDGVDGEEEKENMKDKSDSENHHPTKKFKGESSSIPILCNESVPTTAVHCSISVTKPDNKKPTLQPSSASSLVIVPSRPQQREYLLPSLPARGRGRGRGRGWKRANSVPKPGGSGMGNLNNIPVKIRKQKKVRQL